MSNRSEQQGKRAFVRVCAVSAIVLCATLAGRYGLLDRARRPMVPLAVQQSYLDADGVILARLPRTPRGRGDGEKMFWGPRDRKIIALTFDDGPHPDTAPTILRILRRHNVRATFFVVGQSALAHPELVRAEAAAGNEVSNHTFHHARLNQVRPALDAPEIAACDAVIASITHHPADPYFRPPGGEVNPDVMQVCRRLGKTLVMYSDDPQDFKLLGEKVLLDRLLRNARPGGIILLHDNVRQTIHILPALIHNLKAQGYTFVTISEMDAARKQRLAPMDTASARHTS